MADEREEQSGGAVAKRERPAAERESPDTQGDSGAQDDANAPQPFPERRPLAQSGSGEERYTRDAWKEYARLKLGVSPHAVAGALAHHDPAEEIGRGAVQDALDAFAVRRGAE